MSWVGGRLDDISPMHCQGCIELLFKHSVRPIAHGVQQVDGAIVPPAVRNPVLVAPILHQGRGQIGFLLRLDGLMELQHVAAVE